MRGCNMLQCVRSTPYCSILQCIALCCSAVQCVAVCYNEAPEMTMRDLISHEPYIPSYTCDVTHSIDMTTPSCVSWLIHVCHESFMHRMTHLSLLKKESSTRAQTQKNSFLFSYIHLHACQICIFFLRESFFWQDMGAKDMGLPERDMHTTLHASFMSSQEPHVPLKEPCIPTKHPYISSKRHARHLIWAQYAIKRALYAIESAIFAIERALQSIKRSWFVMTR